ncbi:MAG: PilZ domain-containing protein [Endomicrobiia bacterium]|nr:PilZ domain-containing protein [Endomicrobiia bacterium]
MKDDRRKFTRFPVAHNLANVISMDIKTSSGLTHDEAVIADISAGGLALLTVSDFKTGREFDIALELPSLKTRAIKCRIARVDKKPDINNVGIEFLHICSEDRNHINAIARDYTDCEMKLALGVTDVCFKKCHYYHLCGKNVKI